MTSKLTLTKEQIMFALEDYYTQLIGKNARVYCLQPPHDQIKLEDDFKLLFYYRDEADDKKEN